MQSLGRKKQAQKFLSTALWQTAACGQVLCAVAVVGRQVLCAVFGQAEAARSSAQSLGRHKQAVKSSSPPCAVLGPWVGSSKQSSPPRAVLGQSEADSHVLQAVFQKAEATGQVLHVLRQPSAPPSIHHFLVHSFFNYFSLCTNILSFSAFCFIFCISAIQIGKFIPSVGKHLNFLKHLKN